MGDMGDTHDTLGPILADIAAMLRAKRADYTPTGDPWSNFNDTAAFAGFEYPWLSALFNCQQKLSRVRGLRERGKLADPTNESVQDTLLDNAVYAILALEMFRNGQRNP